MIKKEFVVNHTIHAVSYICKRRLDTESGEYAKKLTPERGYPGSDPNVVAGHLFSERGVDIAVLHPMTRGIMPDRHLGTAIAAAHNEMLVSRWLDNAEFGERFRGTIRVDPNDVAGAVREIEKYKDHPRIVQVGIPMQSRELYGKPQFWPLWDAAAAANLPVAVHIESGEGVAFPPTPSGHTRTYEQYVGFMALNYLYHLMNMIAEGVFERTPNLKFVWADGAADLLTPFMWRMDTFGRPHLEQTPWAPGFRAITCRDTCTSCKAASTVPAIPSSPANGSASPARTTW